MELYGPKQKKQNLLRRPEYIFEDFGRLLGTKLLGTIA